MLRCRLRGTSGTELHTERLREAGHRPIEMNNHSNSIEVEPALEVWARLVNGESIAEVSAHLGYSLQYGCRLASEAASREIDAGINYEFCANLFGENEGLCWKHVQTQLRDEILTKTAKARRMWLLKHIQSLFLSGRSPVAIAVALGITETEVKGDLRTATIVAKRLRGDTLESIASSVDLTRERVRQILKELGVDTKFLSERKAEHAAKINENLEAVGKWIREHPGCTHAEIAKAFDLQENDIAGVVPSDAAHLVLDSRFEQVSVEIEARAISKSRIMHAIHHAATIDDEGVKLQESGTLYLTGPRYTSLQKQGVIDGPTLPRILQVFGTWRNACENAGVSCDEPVQKIYERRWSRAEMSGSVADFLLAEGHNGVSKYDKWARRDDARPSFGTVRNEFGGWKAAYEEALRLLRSNWVMPPHRK